MTAQSFFYWGMTDLASEVQDDLFVGLLQPKRSMFYNRDYGAGIGDYENAPITFGAMTMIKYEAVKFMATRNAVVTDGNSGPDRRAASSQSVITVEQEGPALNVNVGYILLSDMTRSRGIQLPIGGLK